MSNFPYHQFVLASLLGVLLFACTPSATPVETASNTVAVVTATTLPTATLLPPTATPTATPTASATATSTHTPSATPTATATATNTATPLPTATSTPLPPTATPILFTATPLPTATSSLPGNPLPLTGGSYNGCPMLVPGQYTTDPYGCASCPTMDFTNWLMGDNLLQVTAAYEQNGDIHVILSNGQDVNLNALNFRWLVVINSVERAIETWEDSFTSIAADQMLMYSVLGPGTTVGYFNNVDYGTTVMKVTAVCGQ